MRRLLIVDDEPYVLTALKRCLGWRRNDSEEILQIEIFESPQEALQRAQEQEFNLLLSDYRMPQMNGVEFLARMRTLQPQAIRMIMSGSLDLEMLVNAVNDAQIFRFISKPWVDYDLRTSVAQALQYQALQSENEQLADLVRQQRNRIARHEAELRRLERESPGIVRVQWGPNGEVIFDELTAQELQAIEPLFAAEKH